jgi:DNA polymerase-3 subunit delta'
MSKSKFPLLDDYLKSEASSNTPLLLIGSYRSCLLPAAIHVAKSIFCGVPYCDECRYCRGVDSNFLPDYYLIDTTGGQAGEDGAKKTIATQIDDLVDRFLMTSLERSDNKRVYIINEIENVKAKSLNALLKFIEEPPKGVYAIFTTRNPERVLSTILSRTIRFFIAPTSSQECYQNLTQKGVAEHLASLLSRLYSDADLVLAEGRHEQLDKLYPHILECFRLLTLKDNKKYLSYYLEKLTPFFYAQNLDQQYLRNLIFYLEILLKEMISQKYNLELYAFKQIDELFIKLNSDISAIASLISKLDHIENTILNEANPNLVLNRIFIAIYKTFSF